MDAQTNSATFRRSKGDRRIRRLIGAHALLAVVPGARVFLAGDARVVSAIVVATGTITMAQLMLLSFWGGFGGGKVVKRLMIVALAVAYAAVWQTIGLGASVVAPPANKTSLAGCLALLTWLFSMNLIIALSITAAFLAVRRRWSELRYLSEIDDRSTTATVQFSILNVLAITTVAAILFAFMRGARRTSDSAWQMVPLMALMVSTFVIDAVCAVWAALGIGHVRWRIVLALIVAALLGLLLSITGSVADKWSEILTWAALPVLSIAIVMASLWVVRSCGYRLVRK